GQRRGSQYLGGIPGASARNRRSGAGFNLSGAAAAADRSSDHEFTRVPVVLTHACGVGKAKRAHHNLIRWHRAKSAPLPTTTELRGGHASLLPTYKKQGRPI